MNTPAYNRILVFQTAFLGDALLCVPLMRALRKKFPQATLGFVCRKPLGELFMAAMIADVVIEVNKKNEASLEEAFTETQRFAADLIISAHQSFRTAWWVYRLKAKATVGFANWLTAFAYKQRVVRPTARHDVLRQLSLLEPLGVDASAWQIKDAPMDMPLPELAGHALNRFLASSENTDTSNKRQIAHQPEALALRNFIAVAPGSQWNTKRWTIEGYRELISKLKSSGRLVVLLGNHAEKLLCDEIARGSDQVLSLAGRTSVLELAQVLKNAAVLFCNDSGTMHLAVTQGVPVVPVFGPTVPAQGYAPWSEKARLVQIDLPCRPCGRHGHDNCPIGTHDCMKKVTSEMVYRASREFLS